MVYYGGRAAAGFSTSFHHIIAYEWTVHRRNHISENSSSARGRPCSTSALSGREQLRPQRCRGAAHCRALPAPGAAAASSRAAASAGELPLADAAPPAFAPSTGLPLRPPPPRPPIPRSRPCRSPGRLPSVL
jgi:hypothetical protein